MEAEGCGVGFHLELGDEVPPIIEESAVLGQDPFVGDEGFDQFAHATGLAVVGEAEALDGQAFALGGGAGLHFHQLVVGIPLVGPAGITN
jgi:hypothetical protein